MAELIVRNYKRIPIPGYPNSSREDVWDAYLHFFLTVYHLKDYIVNEKTLNIKAKEINEFIENNDDMKLLQAIVTGFKHLNANHDHIAYDIKSLGWNSGGPKPSPQIGYEERNFLLSENGENLLLEDGSKIQLESDINNVHPRELAIRVLAAWNRFFKENSLDIGFVS